MYKKILKIEGEIVIRSESNLTEKEKRLGDFLIPPSYLNFTSEMGFGLLMNLFITYIPIAEESKIVIDSLQNQNKYMRSILDEYLEKPLSLFKNSEAFELIKYGVPFLMSENGEIVFWDSRKNIENEFPIYLVHFPVGVYYIANNFVDFISILSNNETYKKALKFYESPLPLTFQPYNKIWGCSRSALNLSPDS